MSNEEILHYVLENTPADVWNVAAHNFNMQALYERHKKKLLYSEFGGNVLKWGVCMAEIFRPYVSHPNAPELWTKIQIQKIRTNRKNPESVAKYNAMVFEYNQMIKPQEDLRKLYIKLRKKKGLLSKK